MHIINIGLETNDGSALDPRAALVAVLGRTRAVSCGIKQSDTESTLVIVADELSSVAAWTIACALRQDCIAVYDTVTRRGRLIGPVFDDSPLLKNRSSYLVGFGMSWIFAESEERVWSEE